MSTIVLRRASLCGISQSALQVGVATASLSAAYLDGRQAGHMPRLQAGKTAEGKLPARQETHTLPQPSIKSEETTQIL